MAGKESMALTRSLIAISTAKIYLEDMLLDFPEMKRRIDQWINRLSFVTHDALASMTPTGREVFRREISKGDPLQYENIFITMAQMTPDQRNLFEKAGEEMLKGNVIITM